jgi:hypothetical protein
MEFTTRSHSCVAQTGIKCRVMFLWKPLRAHLLIYLIKQLLKLRLHHGIIMAGRNQHPLELTTLLSKEHLQK